MPEAVVAEPSPGREQEKATAMPTAATRGHVPPIPATGEPEQTQPEKAPLESPGLLSDCRLMLSYARKNGFELPADLLYEISWLDGVLAALNISPISAISASLLTALTREEITKGFLPRATVPNSPAPAPLPAAIPPDPPVVHFAAQAAEGLSPEEVVLKVHARLSTLIAPTTALSLQTSEPPPGKAHIFGGMPPLVQNIIWVALASAFFFIVSAAFIAHEAGTARDVAKASAEAASGAAQKASQAAPAPSSAALKPESGASK